jgi:hypothetical protein
MMDGLLSFVVLLLMLPLPLWLWQTIKNYKIAFGESDAELEKASKAKSWFIGMFVLSVLSIITWIFVIYVFSSIHC